MAKLVFSAPVDGESIFCELDLGQKAEVRGLAVQRSARQHSAAALLDAHQAVGLIVGLLEFGLEWDALVSMSRIEKSNCAAMIEAAEARRRDAMGAADRREPL